ncbi:uncharacterized protein B0I36DRAFT_335165 [Microdochium trichocladiopsis]|uniref:Uncharacterized protein n=1 Tax=Microdochium trichocladiopsis TaxID=1682393 RepID=A0A9P8XWY7_9PEZI|nr:uncharacterized protein B0I36DRAFT_335165 [Microdochium trichocladiopsis]KAH7018012.1 hypothetical protein B0I36DRAFT_335165 [Microdochium trichocladiopsis]
MAGGFSYVSLSPRGSQHHQHHQRAGSADHDRRQPSPVSQHHAVSPGAPPTRPVSPLESESDTASAYLGRSVSVVTAKSARIPVVEVHPVIAEEQAYQQYQHQYHNQQHQPGPYDGNFQDSTAGPYDGTQYLGYDQQPLDADHQQHHEQQQYYPPHPARYNQYPQEQGPGQATQSRKHNDDTKREGVPSYRIWSEWMWEIITLVLMFLLLWAVAILLTMYNGKPVPDWGRYINLNTVLALLSTVFRAGLVVVITQVISQRKWSWFAATDDHHHPSTSNRSKPRSLGQLQKFDDGSRNSFKAVWLFGGVLKGRELVALLAALVFLLSFLVGPFVQQASQTMSCSMVTFSKDQASVPIAKFVPRTSGYKRGYPGSIGVPTSDTIVALLSSATVPKGVENRVGFTCSTGNCTFVNGDPVLADTGPSAESNNVDKNSRKNSRRDTAQPAAAASDTSADSTLPFLGHTVDAPPGTTAYSTSFLSTTHSTVGLCRLCSNITSAVQTRRPVPGQGQGAGSGVLLNMTVSTNAFAPIINMTSSWVSPTSGRFDSMDWLEPAYYAPATAAGRAARYALHNTTLLMITDPSGKGDPAIPTSIHPTDYFAAACHLYPCLRTFSAAVEGGKLREVETPDSVNAAGDELLRAERQMWPGVMGNLSGPAIEGLSMSSMNSMWLPRGVFYAAVKSPCRVTLPPASPSEGPITAVYTRQNMSTAPNAVDMVLYQPRILDERLQPVAVASDNNNNNDDDNATPSEPDYHWAQYRVPEECIYRHDVQFHMAIGKVIQDSILKGSCKNDPRTGPACSAPINVIESALEALYNSGMASMRTVDGWFADFADALTARYRFQFGAGAYNATTDNAVMPIGELTGEVWLTGVCIAAELKWLAFPAALFVVTAGLLAWTVLGTWRQRHHRPVWKDSVLPMLFYNAKFRVQDGSGEPYGLVKGGRAGGGGGEEEEDKSPVAGVDDYHRAATEMQNSLLEAKEMQRIADQTMVTFDWPGSSNRNGIEGGGLSTSTGTHYDPHSYGSVANNNGQQDGKDVPRPRRPFFRMPWQQRLSADSLLDQHGHR